MPKKGIHFFATRKDMASRLSQIESIIDYSYVLMGLFDRPEIQTYSTYSDIPNFGISQGTASLHPNFMLMPPGIETKTREVPQRRGGIMCAVDGIANSFLLRFQPSGMYENSFLISGQFHPSEESSSLEMYALFRRHFLKGFESVQSYRVGPEAFELFERGIPLTFSHKAEPSMYLKR